MYDQHLYHILRFILWNENIIQYHGTLCSNEVIAFDALIQTITIKLQTIKDIGSLVSAVSCHRTLFTGSALAKS